MKGIHRLLAAMEDLPDWTLLVAGAGPERPALETQAQPLGDRVRFLGRVSEEEKNDLLSLADVFCLPSDHEGQPLTILEAMAMGVPVVATDPAWVPEGLRRFGYWGSDLPALLEAARAGGRHDGAPVPSYRDLAKRFLDAYSALS